MIGGHALPNVHLAEQLDADRVAPTHSRPANPPTESQGIVIRPAPPAPIFGNLLAFHTSYRLLALQLIDPSILYVSREGRFPGT
jgi:hypothetical protein